MIRRATAILWARTCLGVLAAIIVAFVTVAPVIADEAEQATDDAPVSVASDEDAKVASLPERHRTWLHDVASLITPSERAIFLALDEAYRRDHFIRRFWRVRDPFPATGRNELQESWTQRVTVARERFGDLNGERAQFLLAFGPPAKLLSLHCSELLRPLELWLYANGHERVDGAFAAVFVGHQPRGRGRHRLWHRSQGLAALTQIGVVPATASERRIAEVIGETCIRGSEILGGLSQAIDLGTGGIKALLPPSPSDEWVETFRVRSTAVSEDAEPLAAALRVTYPGRHQTRTVVQGLVAVEAGAADTVEQGAYRGFSFMVNGEVLRQGELFDQFRYRFDLPAGPLAEAEIPLVLQRYLRPGAYTWIVKVEDLTSKRVFRDERLIEVPRVAARVVAVGLSADGSVVERPLKAESAGEVEPILSRPPTPIDARLGEANAQIATGDHGIRLLRPPNKLVVGKVRMTARTRGEGIARVAFELNGRPVLRKAKPPYSAEIDLGDKPRLHTLSAMALGPDGETLARDEIVVNAGPHRFALRLLEPEPGRRYQESVRVHAEVEVPEGERLDRVELFLNETRIATLFQPPFEQPVLLPSGGELTWVRAIAHLADGLTAEDTVFINAPDFVDRVDIQMVEVFATVVDRKRQFVEGLTAEDFVVREDGVVQDIRRFELVRDLPMYAGMVLDTSLSMLEELREVEKAAYQFLETVVSPRDRAAIITFNDAPTLAVRFTSDRAVLAGGLANLVAEGETALYDSIIFALHYFSGIRGKRAVVVLTDGEDSSSRYRYEDVVDFARHAGVALYIVGLDLPTREAEIRLRMRRLAAETGGSFFSISGVNELGRVYGMIEQEVRSQYLIAYQSTSTDVSGAFRRIEVDVSERGLEAKTVSGYVP